jgi:hypothetical protein
MNRLLQGAVTAIAIVAVFSLHWVDTPRELVLAIAALVIPFLVLHRMREPEKTVACPKCGAPLRPMKIPLFASLSLMALAAGLFLLVVLAILAIGFALAVNDLVLLGLVLACFAAISVFDLVMRRRLIDANANPPLRCERCHRRFEAAAAPQAQRGDSTATFTGAGPPA